MVCWVNIRGKISQTLAFIVLNWIHLSFRVFNINKHSLRIPISTTYAVTLSRLRISDARGFRRKGRGRVSFSIRDCRARRSLARGRLFLRILQISPNATCQCGAGWVSSPAHAVSKSNTSPVSRVRSFRLETTLKELPQRGTIPITLFYLMPS